MKGSGNNVMGCFLSGSGKNKQCISKFSTTKSVFLSIQIDDFQMLTCVCSPLFFLHKIHKKSFFYNTYFWILCAVYVVINSHSKYVYDFIMWSCVVCIYKTTHVVSQGKNICPKLNKCEPIRLGLLYKYK